MAEFVNSTEWDIDPEKLGEKIVFSQGTKPKRIFHYTSIGGLQGILENKCLRFTNINYLNDKDEIKAGLDSLAKAIDATIEEKEKMLTPIREIGAETFVCCFSLDEDSLPMWNYYTKEIHNQGYNIEFSDRLLVESILLSNPHLAGCGLSFGVVEYCKNDDSHYSKAFSNEIISSFEIAMAQLVYALAKNRLQDDSKALREWEERIDILKKNKKETQVNVYRYNGKFGKFKRDTSGNYLYFVKRDYFSPEKELRIAITVPSNKLSTLKSQGIYKYRISNGLLIPYLELKFNPASIKGITISPTMQSDLAEQSVQDFLRYCDFPMDNNMQEFVKKSKIPVRF